MRILVVSPWFPPFANAEAYVGGKFVQSLLHMGHHVQVITSRNLIPWSNDSSVMWSDLEHIVLDVLVPTGRSKVKRIFHGIRYRTDSWTAWVADMVKAARSLDRKFSFDLILSRALPWEAHLAGYWIARELRLPWFANCNDPLDFCEVVGGLKPRLNQRLWMRRILLQSDLLIFPSNRLRDEMLRNVKRTLPTAVLPHVASRTSISVEPPDRFTLLHAGTLHAGRSADTILKGFAFAVERDRRLLKSVQLVFVGGGDDKIEEAVTELGLVGSVKWTGRVSYEESLRYIASANVCVLVDCALLEGVYLPSKLVDYLSARKPVLALSPAVGTVNDLAREGGILRVDLDDAEGVARAIKQLWDAFQQHRLHHYAPPEALSGKFDIEVVGQAFDELLNRYVRRLARREHREQVEPIANKGA